MALTVTTDLVQLTDAEADTNWDDIGAQSAALEPDFFVQGSNCLSRAVSNTTKGMAFNNGSAIDFTTGTYQDALVYIWMKTNTPGLCASRAAGGVVVRLCTGSATSNYREWYVDGNDTLSPTDGWICYVIDPQSAGTSDTGTYSAASVQWFGGTMTATTTAKGQNFGIDQIMIGRGEIYVSGTVATAGAGFQEISNEDWGQVTNGRYGIFTEKEGIFFVKGKIIIGHATNNTTWSSTNETVIFETPSYYNGTNVVPTIPDAGVQGATGTDGNDNYLGLYFQGGSGTTTISMGTLVGTDNGRAGSNISVFYNTGLTTPARTLATIGVDNSTMALSLYGTRFTGFEAPVDLRGTGVASDDLFGCVFDGCGQVDSNMEIRNTNFLNTAAGTSDAAYLWNDSDTNIQYSSFINNSRGIEHAASAGSPYGYTALLFSGNTFDVNNTSGSAITVNKSTGSNPSTYTGSTVTFSASFSLTLKSIISGTDVTIVNSSTRTELYHAVSTGADLVYTHGGGETVDILLISLSYDPNLSSIYSLTLPNANSDITFQQIDDPNYVNPP